jgi:ADP-heptose:LPS heptosyltransferase
MSKRTAREALSTHPAQRELGAPDPSGAPRRLLVVKLADIGDAIGTLPAVRALHRTFPGAWIDALVTPGPAREVFHRERAVHEVLTFAKGRFDRTRGMADPRALRTLVEFGVSLRARRYDAVVLFHHLTTVWGARKFRALALATGAPVIAGLDNGRGDFLTHAARDAGFGAKPEWAYWLDVAGTLGASTAETRPTFPVTAEETDAARALLDGYGPYIVLHPGVGGYAPARQWPVARLAAVGKVLAAEGYALVVTGGRDASAARASRDLRAALGGTPARDLTGTCDLGTTAAVYAGAALFIGSDSGMAHLAAAVGAGAHRAGCIAVFGPSNHRAWGPYGAVECNPGALVVPAGARVVVLRSTIPCSPCFYTGYTLGRPNGCPSRNCLLDVQASDVCVVANQLLNPVTG